MKFLENIVYAVITAAVPVLTVFVCKFLQSLYDNKKNQIKNETVRCTLENVTQMIISAVETTSATYVKQLKKDNIFDEEAQKEAFMITYDSVRKQLTSDSLAIINQIYGDIDVYLKNQIESAIESSKK